MASVPFFFHFSLLFRMHIRLIWLHLIQRPGYIKRIGDFISVLIARPSSSRYPYAVTLKQSTRHCSPMHVIAITFNWIKYYISWLFHVRVDSCGYHPLQNKAMLCFGRPTQARFSATRSMQPYVYYQSLNTSVTFATRVLASTQSPSSYWV